MNSTNLVDTVLNVDFNTRILGNTTSTTSSTREVGSRLISKWTPVPDPVIQQQGDGPSADPLAQTFFVDAQKYPYGMFVNNLKLFFRATDSNNLPVTVQIRPTVNAIPSSDYWYPESVVSKYPSEINVSENPTFDDSTTYTQFDFEFPVYLKPGLYSIVVLSDSPEYTLWVAEKGALTTKNEFVDKQPYMGTLYKSQNSMEYVPILNEDMMFVIDRCVFSTTPATFYFQNAGVGSTYYIDKLRLEHNALIPSQGITTLDYSLITTTSTGTKETTYRSIIPGSTYKYSTDDYYQVGYRRKKLANQNDLTVKLDMATLNDAVSPIVSVQGIVLNIWENFIDNAEINAEDFTIIAPGANYSNSNTITITSSTGTGATANLQVDGSGKVIGVYVSSSGSGYLDDFTISYFTHPTTPATIVLNSEYASSGGPAVARYITKPIQLADGYDAGDLRVFLGANKPGSTEVTVFCKVDFP